MNRTALFLRLTLGAICGIVGALIGHHLRPPLAWVAIVGATSIVSIFGMILIVRREGKG
jgi:hypothetical protein